MYEIPRGQARRGAEGEEPLLCLGPHSRLVRLVRLLRLLRPLLLVPLEKLLASEVLRTRSLCAVVAIVRAARSPGVLSPGTERKRKANREVEELLRRSRGTRPLRKKLILVLFMDGLFSLLF
eukprot:scaffold895_cov315-Pinguiococcus_pyrenoidosus.AAC.31